MPITQFVEIDHTKDEHVLQVYPRLPLLSSKTVGWRDIHLGYYEQPAHETPEYCPKQYIVGIHLGQSAKFELCQNNGHFRQKYINYGESCIYPANYSFKERWNRDIEFIEIYLDPIFLTRVAYDIIDLDHVEILPYRAVRDPFLQQIGFLLKAELEANINNRVASSVNSYLYVESLAKTLVIHLFKHYSTPVQETKKTQEGLSPASLRIVTSYIYDHLEYDLSLTEVAGVAHLSSHYFATLFKQSTGETLIQYITRLRIERAKELLTIRKLAIADICQQVGFRDQSYFAKIFRRYTNMTPQTYRRKF